MLTRCTVTLGPMGEDAITRRLMGRARLIVTSVRPGGAIWAVVLHRGRGRRAGVLIRQYLPDRLYGVACLCTACRYARHHTRNQGHLQPCQGNGNESDSGSTGMAETCHGATLYSMPPESESRHLAVTANQNMRTTRPADQLLRRRRSLHHAFFPGDGTTGVPMGVFPRPFPPRACN